MRTQLSNHLKQLVKPLFPRQAFVRGLGKKDLIIAIDWLMDCPEDPPSKRSRLIKIIIREEVVNRYPTLSESQQKKTDDMILEVIIEKLKTFEPKHKIPRGGIAPQVEWPIDAGMLKI